MKERIAPRKPRVPQPRRTEPSAPRKPHSAAPQQDASLPAPASLSRKPKQRLPQLRLIDGSVQRAPPKRPIPFSASVYADLREQLISLKRLPGEVITEAAIAESYGVSRTPVREAILRLAGEGLVEIFPQSGIFVSRIPLSALPEAILIRKALEETTARLAAKQATASQLLALQSILQRQREACAVDDHDAFHEADELFHATIADVAGHPGIWALILQVKVHVDRYRRLTLPQAGRIAGAIVEHEKILAALGARNPAAAVAAIGVHLDRLLGDIQATRDLNPDFFDAVEPATTSAAQTAPQEKSRQGRK
jgi:GntR family transcriptional regulator, rspAB operon transcriptional repressor